MPAVPFDHSLHERVLNCADCHHTSVKQPCISCHTPEGDPKGKNITLAQAMRRSIKTEETADDLRGLFFCKRNIFDEGGAGQISVANAAENGAPSCVQKRRFQTGNKGGG